MTTIGRVIRRRRPRFSLRLMLVVLTALCVFAALHRDRLRVGALAAWARFERLFLANGEATRAEPIVIPAPIQPAGAPPLHDPPSVDEILAALQKNGAARDLGVKLRIVLEPLATYVDPPRVYPLLGPMQLHHTHYQCRIISADGERTIYVNRNHFVGCAP